MADNGSNGIPLQGEPAAGSRLKAHRLRAGLTQAEVAEALAALAWEKDQEHLKALKGQIDNPTGEYPQAQAEFAALDAQLVAGRKQVEALKGAGKLDEAAKQEAEDAILQQEWKAARP